MMKTLKYYLLGFISAVIIVSGVTYAANGTTLYNVLMGGIKIVIDEKEIEPVDANGNTVEPMIYEGTTYLPIRAVANAFGKTVSWDGSTYTVYIGDMNGKLEYPTVELRNMENITSKLKYIESENLTDNYGNRYKYAIEQKEYGPPYSSYGNGEYLLNMKYSRFKATLYVKEETKTDEKLGYITIEADGKIIYTSKEMYKTSAPIDLDLDVKGCNDFKITFVDGENMGKLCLGNAGFYQ